MTQFITMFWGTLGVMVGFLAYTIVTGVIICAILQIKAVRELITRTIKKVIAWSISIEPETGTDEFKDLEDEGIII